MPRYGPPPSAEPPPPPPDDDAPSLTKWSLGAKILAVVAGIGMVAAFVFEFLPPTSPKSTQKISTTVVVPSTSTTLPPTTTSSVLPTTATTL
jgi:hypothetical protein